MADIQTALGSSTLDIALTDYSTRLTDAFLSDGGNVSRSTGINPYRGKRRMHSVKGSHRIMIQDVEYRWRATGNDGWISIGIWPANNIGPSLHGSLRYHETGVEKGKGTLTSATSQIVVTNRIIRRVIEYAIREHRYNPIVEGKELNLGVLEDAIRWDDAVRAER